MNRKFLAVFSFLAAVACDKPLSHIEQTQIVLAQIDKSCGAGGCHGAGVGPDFAVPGYQIEAWGYETFYLKECLASMQCEQPKQLSANQAQSCIQQCVAEWPAGPGFFAATLRKGLMADLLHKSGKSLQDFNINWQAMPLNENVENHFENARVFQQFMAWLKIELAQDFLNVKLSRSELEFAPAGECKAPSLAVENLIRDEAPAQLLTLSMFGCSQGGIYADPDQCFADRVHDLSLTGPDLNPNEVRTFVLRDLPEDISTSFWIRSSPDGKYVSIGAGRIEDLSTKDRSIKMVLTDASGKESFEEIDPVFTADNLYYGWPDMVCPLEPLATIDKAGLNEPKAKCVAADVGLYSSSGLGSGDNLILNGAFHSNGGNATKDVSALATADSSSLEIRSLQDILGGTGAKLHTFTLPGETDFMLSPTGESILSRYIVLHEPSDIYQGFSNRYRIRPLYDEIAAVNPTNDERSLALCFAGEKPMLSFDNRFMVFHHHTQSAELESPLELSQQSLQDLGAEMGAANIFVVDLQTRRWHRITNMMGGSKAYFPHFRADGWLYFLVKSGDGREKIVASNAALIIAKNPNGFQEY